MAKKSSNRKSTGSKPCKDPPACHTVFLSHATADKWIAERMCELIEGLGAKYFRDDRDIDGGDDIPDTIREAIVKAQEVVVLLTPQSVSRDWVKLELGAAWGTYNRIIIVLHHIDTDPLPKTFARRKAVQLNDFDQYLEELKQRIEGPES